ncbi:hypothetical protein B0H13DRAFT_2338001 [Mycena leptocephala]|nr:hypothetical protein B0H13DRAFT_2338001 [Mycena leptocephala]
MSPSIGGPASHVHEQSLTDLWVILRRSDLDLSSSEAIITAVSRIDYPSMTPSIIAMAKYKVLDTLLADSNSPNGPSLESQHYQHPLLPAETDVAHLDDRAALRHRLNEGKLEILADFIQECHQSSDALFKARVASIPPINFDWPFESYCSATDWLDSPDARDLLKETLAKYLLTLSLTDDSIFITYVRSIVTKLKNPVVARVNELVVVRGNDPVVIRQEPRGNDKVVAHGNNPVVIHQESPRARSL